MIDDQAPRYQVNHVLTTDEMECLRWACDFLCERGGQVYAHILQEMLDGAKDNLK